MDDNALLDSARLPDPPAHFWFSESKGSPGGCCDKIQHARCTPEVPSQRSCSSEFALCARRVSTFIDSAKPAAKADNTTIAHITMISAIPSEVWRGVAFIKDDLLVHHQNHDHLG